MNHPALFGVGSLLWAALACQTAAPAVAPAAGPAATPAAAPAPRPQSQPRLEVAGGRFAVDEVRIEHSQLPTFVSGLWVEDDGALGAVVGDGGEGSRYRLQRWPQPAATAAVAAAPEFTISVDDALLVGRALWLAGSLSAHDPGTELLRIDGWPTGPATQAALAVQAVHVPDLPPLHNWRLLDAPPTAGWFAATATPIDPEQQRRLGTVLLLDDRAARQQQLVLLHEAGACLGGSLQSAGDRGSWQVQLACNARDGAPLLVVVEQPAGQPLEVRATHLARDPAIAAGVARCLGGPAEQLVDLRSRGQAMALAVCRQDSGRPRCGVLELALGVRWIGCAALPEAPDRTIDRIAWTADGEVLAASRAGALWRLAASADRFVSLRNATLVGEIAPPRPALSANGRYVLFGRHALEPGERAGLVRVDVTPDR